MELVEEMRALWARADAAEVEPWRRAKHGLAAEVRELSRLTAMLDAEHAGAETVDEVTALLADARERLAALPDLGHRYGSPARAPDVNAHLLERSPFSGRGNPAAPPIELHFDGETVRADVVLNEVFEGPPGAAHGGVVAAIFDEVLGVAQIASGQIGVTGTITIRMRKPTPLFVPVRYEAGVEEVAGRKVTAWGRSTADGEVLAEATGLFIAIRGLNRQVDEHLEQLVEERGEAAASGS